MRMPPNWGGALLEDGVFTLQWRAACACRRIEDVPVGVSPEVRLQWRAACACRRIGAVTVMPLSVSLGFNGGRHAHAAESVG